MNKFLNLVLKNSIIFWYKFSYSLQIWHSVDILPGVCSRCQRKSKIVIDFGIAFVRFLVSIWKILIWVHFEIQIVLELTNDHFVSVEIVVSLFKVVAGVNDSHEHIIVFAAPTPVLVTVTIHFTKLIRRKSHSSTNNTLKIQLHCNWPLKNNDLLLGSAQVWGHF